MLENSTKIQSSSDSVENYNDYSAMMSPDSCRSLIRNLGTVRQQKFRDNSRLQTQRQHSWRNSKGTRVLLEYSQTPRTEYSPVKLIR